MTRGYAEPDETCEVVGIGAVPVTLIRDALRHGASLVTITHTDGTVVTYADHGSLGPGQFAGLVVLTGLTHDRQPVDLGPYDPVALIDHDVLTQLASWAGRPITADSGTRTATTPQRRALTWRSPTCAHPGCDTVHGLEADHTTPWHQTHTTELANLTLRCAHHHQHKTRHDPKPPRQAKRRPQPPPATPHHATLPLVC